MDKITRIHIAKVPYEIGVSAQEELNKYLHEIHRQLDADLADETMDDIEVRITEILTERAVKKNDVISSKDIDAIKAQLGLPEQFSDQEVKINKKSLANNESKRLLRDTDNELICGVASGLGAYFSLDPVIVRIAFIILAFFWGIGIFIYLLLWLMVPPARTNSEKLQMRGEPVTAAALQHYRNSAQNTISSLKLRRVFVVLFKIVRFFITIGAALFILGLLIFIGLASAALYTEPIRPIYTAYHLNYLLLGLLWLLIMTVIGLTVVLLLRFWQRRRTSLKIACFTLLGVMVVTIAGVSVVSPFIVNHYRQLYGGDKLALSLPINAPNNAIPPSGMSVQSDSNLDVSYVMTNQPLHATYQVYPGMGHPNISITNQKGTITIQTSNLPSVVPSCILDWCRKVYLPVKVTIYGPSLQKFSVDGGAELDLSNFNQKTLSLVAQNNSVLNIDSSYSDNFSLVASNGSSIMSTNTTAQSATVTVDNSSNVNGPASTNLNLFMPSQCDQILLFLPQSPTTTILNGQQTTAQSLNQNNCIAVNDLPPFPPEDRPFHIHSKRMTSVQYKFGP